MSLRPSVRLLIELLRIISFNWRDFFDIVVITFMMTFTTITSVDIASDIAHLFVLQTTVSEPGEEQGRAAASMPGVDGVVVMGGDGLLSRVVMGIIQHQAKVDGISLIDSKTPFPKPSIRIGIIPGN